MNVTCINAMDNHLAPKLDKKVKIQLNQAFLQASVDGNMQGVQEALRAGADINVVDKKKYTALLFSIVNHRNDIARFLIDFGANLESKDLLYNDTPLIKAIGSKNYEIAAYLIDKKANIYAVSRGGNTPLSLARKHHTMDLIKKLIDAGA